MRTALSIAADLLREAASRRWVLVLGLVLTAILLVMGLAVRLDVVDGALAATRLFGRDLHSDIRAVDVALRPVYRAASYFVFYGGLGFFILACADFGPSLLAPGRIEHLLALPVRRHELLVGTFLGVLVLTFGFALYGAGGVTLILSVKTNAWSARPLIAALLSTVAFTAIYGAMLATAVFARSAALSAAIGGVVFITGIFAGYREGLSELFDPGIGRAAFLSVTALLPRVSTLANASAAISCAPARPSTSARVCFRVSARKARRSSASGRRVCRSASRVRP